MAVITLTDREKEILSNRYDENKRTFENVLARDLRAFFAGVGDDIYTSLAIDGIAPDFNSYINDLAVILRKNYRITGAFFSAHIQRLIKETAPDDQRPDIEIVKEERSNLDALILASLLPFYVNQSRQQAKFIVDTTKKITNDIVMRSKIDEALTGNKLSQEELARKITKKVNKRNLKRIRTISEDQVGDIAQKAKQEEAVKLAKKLPKATTGAGAVLVVEPRKTWMNVGDGFVRPAHGQAGYQKRELEEPYLVGGQLLMYPKDRSMGASLWNTINCRCNSIVEI